MKKDSKVLKIFSENCLQLSPMSKQNYFFKYHDNKIKLNLWEALINFHIPFIIKYTEGNLFKIFSGLSSSLHDNAAFNR